MTAPAYALYGPFLTVKVRGLPILDSIVAAGAIKDDSQVVQVTARKAFPGEHPQALPVPGLRLYLYEVGDDHASAQIGAEHEAGLHIPGVRIHVSEAGR